MPPHPSRLLTVLAAGSALLCVALMVLWVRSARNNDVLLEPREWGDRWLVTSSFGTFTVERQTLQEGRPKPGWVFFGKSLPGNWPGGWQWFGFDAYRGQSIHYVLLRPAPAYGVSVPHWFLIALAGALPMRWLQRHSRAREGQRRGRRGQCLQCGYDLRATPEAGGTLLGQCPECGLRL